MCGISGFIDSRVSADEGKSILERSLELTKHRGPDARSTWLDGDVFLGHNRLSIIDLSEAGTQPFHYGHLVLIFNGEIYNYLEIKEELIAQGFEFKTSTDTEVIAAAFLKWGKDCVSRFVGMWAFAIWDKNEKTLFCSRDRFGIKPFYYLFDSGRFYFCSEIKGLTPSPIFSNLPNIDQIARGIQIGYVSYSDETYFKKVHSLPAGMNLTYRNGGISISSYWDIESKTNRTSLSTAIEEFGDIFKRSIHLHLRADVDVGGCLSGGLDSSSIASAVSKEWSDKTFKAFHIYYDGKGDVDERGWIAEIQKQYPGLELYTDSPSPEHLLEKIPEIIRQQELPIAGSSPISQYYVMDLAAKHGMKVLLDGQGADEYLGGYNHAFPSYLASSLRKGKIFEYLSRLVDLKKVKGLSPQELALLISKSALAFKSDFQDYTAFEFKNKFKQVISGTSERIPFHFSATEGSRFQNYHYHLVRSTILPTLLHYEDRNSMAFSIESRVPFLDHRLVEYAFSLPEDFLINKGRTKYLLRESMKGVIPNKIYNRQDKKGFVTPGEVKWLRGSLSPLTELNFKGYDFVDQSKVNSILEGYKAGDNGNAKQIWRLAMLQIWLKEFRI